VKSLAVAAFLILVAANGGASADKPVPVEIDDAGARAFFLKAAPVFLSPRCLNCHPSGERPLQGDRSRPHVMNVKRGPEGKGITALRCANCHQPQNTAGRNMPPGAPNWHLPPPSMKMVFEGRTPAQICATFKDPDENGGKTVAQIVEHVTHDPLVKWGWSPGEGRTLPPLNHKAFAVAMKAWADKGAACPE
jgi:hypothetical protein